MMKTGQRICHLSVIVDKLREAMHQGKWDLCWAVAHARCIEAWIHINYGIVVHLSPQHLVNNIWNKCKETGKVKKYNEIRDFLMTNGLVLEETCPFSGEITANCPKSCLKSDGPAFKIKDLKYVKRRDVNEEELIKLVIKGPILAEVEAFQSFLAYKDTKWKWNDDKKEQPRRQQTLSLSQSYPAGGLTESLFWRLQVRRSKRKVSNGVRSWTVCFVDNAYQTWTRLDADIRLVSRDRRPAVDCTGTNDLNDTFYKQQAVMLCEDQNTVCSLHSPPQKTNTVSTGRSGLFSPRILSLSKSSMLMLGWVLKRTSGFPPVSI
ncbi:hypothetical protein F2Q70_00014062 [Brassica cretica]|uniref:Peptidase C1A papain C-terminal domain-containing protein n=1 Tax=Brassica cretica TaxID=69181 RepID=A0A8S9HYW8_BRACR|nr:hypothetical protein F2Q70_00014062 [Brassica cretica]